MTTEADRFIKKGDAYLGEGMFDKAIKAFTKAIAADPRRPGAYCRRAEAYFALAQALVGKEPCGTARLAEFLGKMRARKELDLSLKDLSTAVELSPDLAEGYFGQGAIHYERGRYKEAVAAFTKALPLQEKKAETYFRRAVAYERLNDDAQALKDLDACLREDPTYADAYLEKGVIYSSQERYEEARREIDKAIALNPRDARYYSQRAMAMCMPAFKSGDEGALWEALVYMDQAIKLEPKNAETYFDRGLIYRVLGESELELADFSTTITLDPEHASAYRQRFECFVDSDQENEAVRDWIQYCARAKKAVRFSKPQKEKSMYSVN